MHLGYDRSQSRTGHRDPGPLSLDPLYSLHLSMADAHGIDTHCTSRVFHILDRLNCELEDVVSCHVQHVHPWLPIIHPRSLAHRVSSLRQSPSAELSSLVINILLSNPPITAFVLDPALVQYVYNSGLLLAVYEQGSGHLSDAYLTLSTCASLGYAIGLHKLPDSNTSDREERKRVWWATYLLDRLVYYSDKTTNRIPLTQSARVGDALPIHDDMWTHHTDAAQWVSDVPILSITPIERLGCFAQQIQAMSLLDRVITPMRDGLNRPKRLLDEDIYQLDTAIQNALRGTLNSSGTDWEPRYRAVVILLLALLEHHETASASVPHENKPALISESSIAAIEMALNFARDIVLMDDILDNQRMPLAAVLLLEKAGTMAIVLNAHYKRNIDVLEPLIGSLERASKRWTIAALLNEKSSVLLNFQTIMKTP
ncbi:hypothetical protein BDV40DRAFT_295045 [Aspergillus tamarii]|uniref:Xylanolytic transcriptional activator regulatory domain-containing protein n=1 Tax=Aspergillus tamarii TaxID=41984 RepID=A0A5N6VA73_ASPTM|nr:hypothetical protein BDV40DRAFT_295045 [Aspergillus tamarii]